MATDRIENRSSSLSINRLAEIDSGTVSVLDVLLRELFFLIMELLLSLPSKVLWTILSVLALTFDKIDEFV